ncbi:glycosyltransferase family 4 protein [Halieaceae bacterium IMCC14734]|uniref:Glycosyltransferase family 4 protein n=1 Tax=Candidatus Litorirhabdus singularis TaxID=2518993 RepID=A0ABT3TIG1_9GAMM|nr:glycosyltransferase [Candidatus Litorirhabdus singularis]MCX2982102.1 glycosyltransferase family 4 protein [Candidatus Litorirhabdus singularis]
MSSLDSGAEIQALTVTREFCDEAAMSSTLQSEDLVLVHDYLIQMGGAERVVATMANAFPESPIYTSATERPALLPELIGREIHNTWVDSLPGVYRHFKKLFPIYPVAFKSLRIPSRKAAWISSSTFAKCIRAPEGMITFCYLHNPTRFLWDAENFLRYEVSSGLVRAAVKASTPYLRRIDIAAARRMDHIIANSENVRKQIEQCYDRESTIIYPPVNVERFEVATASKGYYLVLSRLVGYKGLDRAVLAFRGLDRILHVVGEGPDRARLESLAGDNVRFFGHVSDEEIREQLSSCEALIFPGFEDFGIVPVEAQACGKPVIAYAKGGALETVVEGETGVFFREPTAESLRDALLEMEKHSWDTAAIRRHAEQFSETVFLEKMTRFMAERL